MKLNPILLTVSFLSVSLLCVWLAFFQVPQFASTSPKSELSLRAPNFSGAVIASVYAEGLNDSNGKTSHSASRENSHNDSHSGGHEEPFADVLLMLGVIILAAGFGRTVAQKLEQPAVLGELIIGVIIGNILYFSGSNFGILVMHLEGVQKIFELLWTDSVTVSEATRLIFSPEQLSPGGVGELVQKAAQGIGAPTLILLALSLWVFSNLGVIILLFMVGLETTIDEMQKVGARALLVALVGIIAPFALGYGSGVVLLPDSDFTVHLFLAATLCATSVGITARVFLDLGKLRTKEARTILGAAVFDDIFGLIILAVVSGIVATGEFDWIIVFKLSGLSFLFLGGLVLFGGRVLERQMPLARFLTGEKVKLLFPLSFAFILSWCSSQIGLASIVGAFAAGLVLSDKHFLGHSDKKVSVHQYMAPLEAVFVPIFFVLMGMQVNLKAFATVEILLLSIAFIIVAVIGKLVAGIPAGKDVDRLSVGIGMVPRGEVGLIFASIGKSLGVVTDGVFSAIVIMVIVTTLITPIALKWSLNRKRNVSI